MTIYIYIFVLRYPILPAPYQAFDDLSKHTNYSCITVILTFHSFLSSLARLKYLPLFSFSLIFYFGVHKDGKVFYRASFLFCLLSVGLVFWPGLGDLFVCQNSRELHVSHWLRRGIYDLIVWSNFSLLLSSQWITFPTHSSVTLYSLFASMLHTLIM